MLLAFALQVAGIKPEYEARLVKDLQKVASSKAVAYVTTWLKDAPKDQDLQLTFLDAKATVVTKLAADFQLDQVQISPDGTMVAALVETYVGGTPMDVTDVLVVTKDGLLAKTHVLASSRLFWLGDSLMIHGYVDKLPLTRFGPDPELGGWACKKLSDLDIRLFSPGSDSYWVTETEKGTQSNILKQIDASGSTKKSVDIGKRYRSPKLHAANTPFMLVSTFHFLGDGEGGYDSLFVMNLDTKEELPIAREASIISTTLWLSGPGYFGYSPGRGSTSHMAFFSPTTGKTFTLGPDVFSPCCVALDADTALLVGGGKAYKLVPAKYRFEKIEIPGVANPDHIYACR